MTENEVVYLKTILKQRAEKWEDMSTLADIHRHCKFTIRMLTRSMANIDNKKVFKKNKIAGNETTKLMVYRASSLYSAKGEA